MCVLDSLDIHGIQSQHCVQMFVRIVVFGDVAEIVHIREVEILCFGKVKDSLTFYCCKEFSTVVEQFESIPLAWVVGGCEDDSAVGLGEGHGHFCGRGGGETNLHDIHATGHQGADDKVLDHLAGQSCVLADDDFVLLAVRLRLS